MTYIILYVFLAALCALGISFAPAGMDVKTAMDRLNKLRFVFAILIIFTHCTLPYQQLPVILFPLRKVSTFGVGYFFILSGYGLAYSAAHKAGYLHNFWKKIGNLLWLTLLSSVISTVLKGFAFGKTETLRLINWYMPAMIVLYLAFWAAYSLFPKCKNKRMIFLFALVFVIILSVCCFDRFTGQNHRNYYISELAFPCGAFVYEYADSVAKFLKKKYAVLVIALAEIISGGLALIVPERGVLDLLFHNFMLFPVGLFLIWLMDKIKIDNPVLETMNRYSLFIYLFQFPVLEILKNYYLANERPFDVMYFLGCLGLTCVLAVILQNLYHSAGRALHQHLKQSF